MIFCSQEPLKPGMYLELQLDIKNYDCKLKFLVESHQVNFQAEMKEMVFSTGMIILAVNKTDLEFFTRVIEISKEKG